jgi:hypothetical protein
VTPAELLARFVRVELDGISRAVVFVGHGNRARVAAFMNGTRDANIAEAEACADMWRGRLAPLVRDVAASAVEEERARTAAPPPPPPPFIRPPGPGKLIDP